MTLKMIAKSGACATAILALALPAGADTQRGPTITIETELLGGSLSIGTDGYTQFRSNNGLIATNHNNGWNTDRNRDWNDRDWDDDDDDWRNRDWNNQRNRNRGNNDDFGFGNRNQRGAIILFEDPNYRGDRLPINGAVRHLRNSGMNDEVSSIRVRQGNWLVCTDPDYRGNCRVVANDQSAFRSNGFNDRISSLRPISAQEARRYANGRNTNNGDWNNGGWGNTNGNRNGNNTRNANLIAYTDPDGRGRALGVNRAINNLRPLGFNDNISSIQIRSGSWELCSDPDFRGRCRVIDQSVGYTRNISLNDNISSIRPVNGNRRRWN